jgi:hypothetical protein
MAHFNDPAPCLLLRVVPLEIGLCSAVNDMRDVLIGLNGRSMRDEELINVFSRA